MSDAALGFDGRWRDAGGPETQRALADAVRDHARSLGSKLIEGNTVSSMIAYRLNHERLATFQQAFDEHNIVVWQGRDRYSAIIRVSIAPYTTSDDIDALFAAWGAASVSPDGSD